MAYCSSAFRTAVRHRHRNTCYVCGRHEARDFKLTIHHINAQCDWPELAEEDENGVLLCREPCHDVVDGIVSATEAAFTPSQWAKIQHLWRLRKEQRLFNGKCISEIPPER